MQNHSEKIYLYPRWIRAWHVVNALMCLLLIVTGLSIQFSNPSVIVQFKMAVAIHGITGIVLTINYLLFFFGNLLTPNGSHYMIGIKGFTGRLTAQVKYYTIGIFKKENPPFPVTKENKFNPLQQFSYVAVMYILIPLVIVSGIGLLYPELTLNSVLGASGLDLTDMLHIISGFFITVFMCIHIYFCTIGKTPTSNFKSMIDGYHESH